MRENEENEDDIQSKKLTETKVESHQELKDNSVEKENQQKDIEEIIDKFGLIEEKRNNNKKSVYWSQTKASVKKTLIIFKRHYKTTILLFSSPAIIIGLLIFLQFCLKTWSTAFILMHPKAESLEKIKKCEIPSDCITIMTIVLDRKQKEENKNEVNYIMKYVSENNDLELGKDIQISPYMINYIQFSDYIDTHKNKTFYGVVFCYDFLDTSFFGTKINIPCKPQFTKEGEEYKFYTIVYNLTNSPNDFLQMPYEPRKKDPQLMKLKLDIDNAYLQLLHQKYGNKEKKTPQINVTFSDYPTTEHRFFGNTSIVNNFGAPFFLLIPITLFILILVDVVREKQLKLRKSLLIIGMTNSAFWSSWMFVILFFSALLILIFLVLCYILQWELFLNVPFPIMFSLFFIFTVDLQFLAFFLSTVLENVKTAYAVAFCIIVVAAVIEGIFTVPFIYQIMFSDEISWTVFFFKVFIYLFCPYSFSKAYLEIATIASTKLNEVTFMNTEGRPYEYSDLFVENEGDMILVGGHYKIPATYESFILLVLDGLLYIILAWYFDNVLESNRGKGKSPIFFIYKIGKVLGLYKPKKKLGTDDEVKLFSQLSEETQNSISGFRETIDSNIVKDNLEESKTNSNMNAFNIPNENDKGMKSSVIKGYQTVLDEYSRIMDEEKRKVFLDGLRIVGASKVYNLSHGKKLKALDQIYMDVTRGELLTLLGHNGAGKTTLINALCGNIPITSGYAIINDVNITDENVKSKYKRKLIGLCPQHDILWDELTPKEHIELYSVIRNYEKEDIEEIAKMKMKEVNLEQVMNEKVGTFSGGMKRRISILLSTIGNPNVVFLDEPSTGLDPVNRRFIWDMIKEIKKKSSVILTTHSMNEAEFLSDRICVIKKGTMQCIGSSLDLKKIFGEGYILTFICQKNSEEEVKNIILNLSDDIRLVSSKGASLIFSLNFEKIGELNWFIKILNKDYSDKRLKPLEGLIKECGIEQTSIEEIFLKIAKEEGEDVNDGELIEK